MTDVRTIRFRTFAAEAAAALIGPCPVIGEDEMIVARLLDGGDYRRDDDGWAVHWHGALTPTRWRVDVTQVIRRVTDAGMVGRDAGMLGGERAEAITAALLAGLDARETAPPAHTASVQTLATALAGRLHRTREVWREPDGALLWRKRPIDPVLGGGPDVAVPETGDGWAVRLGIRRPDVPGGEPVTAPAVRDVVERGTWLQYGEHVDDWAAVVAELGALAGTRP